MSTLRVVIAVALVIVVLALGVHYVRARSLDPSRLLVGPRQLESYDFGDAPDSYGTKLPVGARHYVDFPSTLYLGPATSGGPDQETNGQPAEQADGDDTDNHWDDENGVAFVQPLVVGEDVAYDVTVTAASSAKLWVWIDFNSANGWSDPADNVYPLGLVVSSGVNHLVLHVPDDAVPSPRTYARFRLTIGDVPPQGFNDPPPGTPGWSPLLGEVEDYTVAIHDNKPEIVKRDNIDPVFVGESFQYSLTTTYYAHRPLRSITVVDPLPTPVTFIGASPVECTYSTPPSHRVACGPTVLTPGTPYVNDLDVRAPMTFVTQTPEGSATPSGIGLVQELVNVGEVYVDGTPEPVAQTTETTKVYAPCQIDAVLTFDVSGSMTEPGKLPAAKTAAKGFVDALHIPPAQAAVVSFWDSYFGFIDQPLTQDKDLLRTAIDGLVAHDTETDIAWGLTLAYNAAFGPNHEPNNMPVIILLSDGQHSDREDRVLQVAAAIKSAGVRIVAICFGIQANERLMSQIASPGFHPLSPDVGQHEVAERRSVLRCG